MEEVEPRFHHQLLVPPFRVDEFGGGSNKCWLGNGKVFVTSIFRPRPTNRDFSPLKQQKKSVPRQDMIIMPKILP